MGLFRRLSLGYVIAAIVLAASYSYLSRIGVDEAHEFSVDSPQDWHKNDGPNTEETFDLEENLKLSAEEPQNLNFVFEQLSSAHDSEANKHPGIDDIVNLRARPEAFFSEIRHRLRYSDPQNLSLRSDLLREMYFNRHHKSETYALEILEEEVEWVQDHASRIEDKLLLTDYIDELFFAFSQLESMDRIVALEKIAPLRNLDQLSFKYQKSLEQTLKDYFSMK